VARVDSEFVRMRKQKSKIRSSSEKAIDSAGKFPACKGLYPDCPEKPDKENKMCRSCPVLDKE